MKRRSESRPRQVVSEEVLASLLGLIQRKFYAGFAVEFAKHSKHLQRWVIFWPARYWFDPRGVTLPNARYLEIMTGILMDAAMHQTGQATFPPAFLRRVVQNHFKHHGDEYYQEAKSVRSLADHALATLGKMTPKNADDIVARFVAADRLLEASKRAARQAVKSAPQKVINPQLNLL